MGVFGIVGLAYCFPKQIYLTWFDMDLNIN